MAQPDSGGRVQYAMHHLLTAWGEHDRRCAEEMTEARREVERLARMLDGIDGGALGREITDIMLGGTARAEHELRQAGESYATETRALLALLTGDTALTSAPFALPAPGAGFAGIVATFPTTESRRHVAYVLDDHPASSAYPAHRAEAAPTTEHDAPAHHVVAYTAQFPAELRETITAMITHPRSHAIQAHGPDVAHDALKARVTWRKDPVGRTNHANRWTRHPEDGTVITNHGIGAIAGRFNSIEALAKPLQALLHACGGTLEGLNAYLSENSKGRVARIYVRAADAELRPGDSSAYRGAGAQTAKMADHWMKARDYAMDHGVDPMPIVPTDPIADSTDAGAAMNLRKTGDMWIMTTCYPAPQQPQDYTRLRGSIS